MRNGQLKLGCNGQMAFCRFSLLRIGKKHTKFGIVASWRQAKREGDFSPSLLIEGCIGRLPFVLFQLLNARFVRDSAMQVTKAQQQEAAVAAAV